MSVSNGERESNPKVEAGCADEVGERGAYRKVNRISSVLFYTMSLPGGHPGQASRQLKPCSTGAFPYVLGHTY